MKHPDELILLRMVDSELAPKSGASTRTHLVECASCQSSYESLKQETEILRAALREDPEPLPEAYRGSSSLSWLVAAIVGFGIVGITSLRSWLMERSAEGLDAVNPDATGLLTTVVVRGLLFRGWTDLGSRVTEVGALVLGVIAVIAAAIGAVRSFRKSRFTAMTLLFLASLTGLSRESDAAVIELDQETYRLAAGDTISNDLIVAAQTVRIEGVVEGDLIVAARRVEISGAVRGDVLGVAEKIEVTGEIGGSLRTGSGALELDGSVTRNVTAGGERLTVRDRARIGGSFIAGFQDASIAGIIDRDVIVAAATQQWTGQVGGSALLAGGRAEIQSGAVIEGPAKFYGAHEPVVSSDAELATPVVFEQLESRKRDSRLGFLRHFVYFWAAAFVLGAAFVLLSPQSTEAITAIHLPTYARSFLVGILAVVGAVVACVAFAVTMVGIPLALVTAAVLVVGLYAAQVYVGVYIGRQILGRPTDRGALLVRLAVGLLAIHIAKSIPHVEGLVSTVVSLWGFGAMALWIADRFTSRTATPPAQAS